MTNGMSTRRIHHYGVMFLLCAVAYQRISAIRFYNGRERRLLRRLYVRIIADRITIPVNPALFSQYSRCSLCSAVRNSVLRILSFKCSPAFVLRARDTRCSCVIIAKLACFICWQYAKWGFVCTHIHTHIIGLAIPRHASNYACQRIPRSPPFA